MIAQGLRVQRWSAEDLGQVTSQMVQVLGVQRVREGMVEHRIFEASLVQNAREGGDHGLSAGDFVDRRSIPLMATPLGSRDLGARRIYRRLH
jgi:hypothetical protein